MRRVLGSMVALCALACAIVLGCSSDDDLDTTPRSFDRPKSLAFFCIAGWNPNNPDSGEIVDLELCRDAGESFTLVGLVIQTSRGEVAAVNLRTNRLLDSDTRVPGFTFSTVGEVPSDIVVPRGAPGANHTFVANFGSRNVTSIPTRLFLPNQEQPDDMPTCEEVGGGGPGPRPDAGSTDASTADASVDGGVADGAVADGSVTDDGGADDGGPSEGGIADGGPDAGPFSEQVACAKLAAGPSDLALSPAAASGQFLYVALADEGTIVELETDPATGEFVRSRTIALSTQVGSAPDLTNEEMFPVVPAPDAYKKICPTNAVVSTPPARIEPRANTGDTGRSRPVQMIVDELSTPPRLIVADEGLPILHVFDIDASGQLAAEGEPIVVSVPTRDVAISPPVPESLEESSSSARYIYAVDATDQSILVVDDALRVVLPVSTNADATDRIRFRAGVRVIEVITPEYDTEQERMAASCDVSDEDADEAGPVRLRGVFLAAGLTDGTVRVIDVHDLDAPCRGGEGCMDPPTDADERVFIRRHRPRIGNFVQSDISVVGVPSVVLNGNSLPVAFDGSTNFDVAPDLARLGACPEGMIQIYPATDDQTNPVLCSLADPSEARAEQWVATYEGFIPGTRGGRGRFEAGAHFNASDASFCSAGVEAGDQLVITSELSTTMEENPDCAMFLPEDESADPPLVAFEILDATRRDALGLGEPTPEGATYTRDDVTRCFPNPVAYEVRSLRRYTVLGARSGFLHQITEDATGGCVSPAADDVDPRLRGRAVAGELYANPYTAFQIEPVSNDSGAPPLPPETSAELVYSIGTVPSSLFLDIGLVESSVSGNPPTLPEVLTYSDIDQRLYLVDIASKGLVPIDLDRFSADTAFE